MKCVLTIPRRRSPLVWTILALAAVVLAPGIASAQTLLDPATLQIGGSVPPPGGDPNQIGNTGVVNIYQNQASAGNLNQPFLLILGIANDTSGGNFFKGVDPIKSVTSYNPATSGSGVSGTGGFGGVPSYITNTTQPDETHVTWNATTGFGGSLTSTSADAYSLLGFNGTDKSNNFVNWQGADQTINGINATKFGIYVFVINAELDGQGYVSVQFDTSKLPIGTYAIAYGQNSTHLFDTPFTQAGLTTGSSSPPPPAVPEPSTMALVLSGLIAGGFFGLRRLRRPQFAVV